MKLRKLFRTRNGLAMRRLENLIRNGKPFRFWVNELRMEWTVTTPYGAYSSCSLDTALCRAVNEYVQGVEKEKRSAEWFAMFKGLDLWPKFDEEIRTNSWFSAGERRHYLNALDAWKNANPNQAIDEYGEWRRNEIANNYALREDRDFTGKAE